MSYTATITPHNPASVNIPKNKGIERKEITYTLTDTLNAKILIFRDGQEHPSEGNRVIVKACLYLPSHPKNKSLHPELQFRSRIEVLDRYLKDNWGWAIELERKEGYVSCYLDILADKWSDAFTQAEQKLLSELDKIRKALAEREEALLLAEED